MQPFMTAIDPTTVLVKKVQSGDRQAFDALASALRERLESYLRARIRAHVRHKIDVQDLVQETFARAFECVERFQGEDLDAFAGWITGIGRNVFLKAMEKDGRRQPLKLVREPEMDAPSPSKAMRRKERLEHLERSLRGLSPDYQEVVRLARIDGLPLEEVARRMHRSPAAAKKLLWRALKELKDAFGDTESLHLPPRPGYPGGGNRGD